MTCFTALSLLQSILNLDFLGRKVNQWITSTVHDLSSFIAMAHVSKTDGLSQNQGGSASLQKDNLRGFFADIRHLARQQAKTAVNDWLDITKFDEKYNVNNHYEKQVLSRLEGTCEWIFFKSAYRTWASEDHDNKAKFLWICAPPGFGKTVLCAKLVEHFKKTLAVPIAYFFSSAHAQSGGHPNAIIRFWIGQIVHANSDALDLVRGYCERSEAGRIASETDVWSVFEFIISQNLTYTFALDGFDEYERSDDARAQFLRRLKKATEGTSTRILVSSRDEIDIRFELLSQSGQNAGSVIHECKIFREDVQDDVRFYSRSVVNEKLPKKDEVLRQDLANQLAERCDGMFLWIKLQQDHLRGGKNAKQLQNIVKNMPTGLKQTYERNWKTIQNRPVDEQKRALAILRWATFGFQPLQVLGMTEALVVEIENESARLQWDELPDGIDDEYINGEIIDICGCLVEAKNVDAEDAAEARSIQLIHPSVRDFLLSVLAPHPELNLHHSLLSDQASDQSGHHNYLAKICLIFLNHEDMWKRFDDDQELGTCGVSFMSYAGTFWHSHVAAAGNDDPQVIRLINEFLCLENVNFERWRKDFGWVLELKDERGGAMKAAATALHYAARLNLIPVMEFILGKETGAAQLNCVGGAYGTPLQVASLYGHSQAVNVLIRWGADPNVRGGRSGVPLNAAVAGAHIDIVHSLLDIGASVELQDCLGQTPLFIASVENNPAIANLLLRAGAGLETVSRNEWSPLIAAASNGHLEMVKLLLDRGANVNKSTDEGWTSLHWAVKDGDTEMIKLLLNRGAEIACPNNRKWRSMHLAVQNGRIEIVKLFLDRMADVNITNNGGATSLHWAAWNGHFEMIKLLLNRGADINMSTNDGCISLHLAAENGHCEVVKLLLDRGADINMSTNDGRTSLHLAVENGHCEVVKLLLDRGADASMSKNDEFVSMRLAAQNVHFEVVRLLLDRGADVNFSKKSGWTLLHAAVQQNHFEMIKLLLDRGADFMNRINGRTSVHLAVENGHLEVVQLLLDQLVEGPLGSRFDVNNLGGPEGSIVNTAAYKGQLRILKMLVEKYNAKIFATDGMGRTPLHFAARSGDIDCVNYLLDVGLHCRNADNVGNNILHYACSGGSVEIVRRILKLDPTTLEDYAPWSPLHWACRAGDSELIRLLLSHGIHSSVVHTTRPSAYWTPVSIGVFHRNPCFETEAQQSLIKELEGPASSCTESFPGTEFASDLRGNVHVGVECDGCFNISFIRISSDHPNLKIAYIWTSFQMPRV